MYGILPFKIRGLEFLLFFSHEFIHLKKAYEFSLAKKFLIFCECFREVE